MSWSLQLRNGDLALFGSQLGVVSREQKLVQDLRCALLEHMGNDSMHPEFGSLIDGGRKPDGTEVTGVLGEGDLDLVVMAVEAEILRVIRAYQAKQLARAKGDRMTYNKSTLSPAEVVLGVQTVDVSMNLDQLNITVGLISANNRHVTLSFPFDAPGLTV